MSCDHGHHDPDHAHDFRPLGPPHREPSPTQVRRDRASGQRQRMLDQFELPTPLVQAQRDLLAARQWLAEVTGRVNNAQAAADEAQALVYEAQAAVDKAAAVA